LTAAAGFPLPKAGSAFSGACHGLARLSEWLLCITPYYAIRLHFYEEIFMIGIMQENCSGGPNLL
jgi:hypothetical protein